MELTCITPPGCPSTSHTGAVCYLSPSSVDKPSITKVQDGCQRGHHVKDLIRGQLHDLKGTQHLLVVRSIVDGRVTDAPRLTEVVVLGGVQQAQVLCRESHDSHMTVT